MYLTLGAVAWSVGCSHHVQPASRLPLASSTFFHGEFFPSSADSRRASCHLLEKDLALNICELPQGGLPRNSVFK